MSKCVKFKRKQRTLEEKYEIIKYYESIEHQGRGSKEETRKKFDLISISSLNTILSQKDEVERLHETNQSMISRVRLTSSRLPQLDQQLYDAFVNLRSKKVEISGEDVATKAIQIKEKILAQNKLSSAQREQLEKFKASTGFVKTFNNRHNIKFKNLSGEAGSVDENVVILMKQDSISSLQDSVRLLLEKKQKMKCWMKSMKLMLMKQVSTKTLNHIQIFYARRSWNAFIS
jgi:hypothetical protein